MWRQSDVLNGRPIHPRVLALGQSRLLTAMCWDCVRVAGGQPWLSWPKFCAVFLCSAFCKQGHSPMGRGTSKLIALDSQAAGPYWRQHAYEHGSPLGAPVGT